MKVPPDVIIDVRLREGNRCALCGLPVQGRGHVHHRKPRGMGSSSGRNTLSNLIYLHATCHLIHIESQRERAYSNGWLIRGDVEPAEVPLVYMLDKTVYLTDNGTVIEKGMQK